jgi:hypothetical protein
MTILRNEVIIAFIIITLFIRLCNKVDILLTCKALAWLHCFTKRGGIGTYNTVVSNHFHSVKILFSSAVEDRTLKRHISIGVFVVYIDTGSSMLISPSKSRDLADENKILTEWK